MNDARVRSGHPRGNEARLVGMVVRGDGQQSPFHTLEAASGDRCTHAGLLDFEASGSDKRSGRSLAGDGAHE